MRLPSDAALILIDLQLALDDPRFGPRNNPGAEQTCAALLAAWRDEALPIVHIRHDSIEPDSPYHPGRPGHAFKPETAPLAGEAMVAKHTSSAFVDTTLEAALDEFGAMTLAICGALTHNSVEATARHAADLGYRVFVIADACWAVDLPAPGERAWPAEVVHRLALACLAGEYAAVVDSQLAIAAAQQAKARQRLKAQEGAKP